MGEGDGIFLSPGGGARGRPQRSLECMYGHTYSKSIDRLGEVANPARDQLNRENEYCPVHVRA